VIHGLSGEADSSDGRVSPARLGEALERLYRLYNRRDLVEPDPLQFLYGYPDLENREIAGLAASGLAYGRVASILTSVGLVLDCLGPAPSRFLREKIRDHPGIERICCFRHRFSPGVEVFSVLAAAARLQAGCGGSLQELFRGPGTILERQERFVEALLSEAGLQRSSLLPRPSAGSACKRLNLFLRWMVRRDEVDPGGWHEAIAASELLVPLDVHMHRAGRALGFTSRKQGDLKTVEEITRGFAQLRPDDPVRYDFAITRFGIRRELTMEGLMEELRVES
jgi:uncharacterized protein (TIGR02757 family)